MNGDEIRERREASGLTQQQLAALVGVGLRTVGNWERGETVPKNRAGKLRQVFADLTSETVGPTTQGVEQAEDLTLRFRKPENMSDTEWERHRAKMQGYWDALVDEAAQER